jgi:hypothetical protein
MGALRYRRKVVVTKEVEGEVEAHHVSVVALYAPHASAPARVEGG